MNENIKLMIDLSPAAAAFFGGISALVAAKALLNTSKSAKESQEMNARQGFEQRYTLLLTQHNALHDALCEHLKVEPTIKNANGVEIELLKYNHDVIGMEKYFYYLTGHPIISPYMRVLYHLLKHINSDPYIANKSDAEKKRYSSPLRSYIKNEVLFLIAINALNVKDQRLKKTGYPEYQKLLHRFSFFEHAVFSNPRLPNEPFSETLESLKNSSTPPIDINDTIAVEVHHILIKLRISLSWVAFKFEQAAKLAKLPEKDSLERPYTSFRTSIMLTPEESIKTPFLASIIVYDTPHSDAITAARKLLNAEILEKCKRAYEDALDEMRQSSNVTDFIGGFYYDDGGQKCTVKAFSDLKNLGKSLSQQVINNIKVFSGDVTSLRTISLSNILKDIEVFEKYEKIEWPQNKEDFYIKLDMRIYSVLVGAMNSLKDSYQHKFPERRASNRKIFSRS